MKTIISKYDAFLLAGVVLVSVASSEPVDFSRYQIIIDKNLFGEIVPEVLPAAANQPAVPPQKSFVETHRLCGIHDERDGAWVSFVDVGINPNESFMIKVGEDNGKGIKVLEADVVGGRALLKKGDEEKWLGMEQAPASVPPGHRTLGVPPPFVRTQPPSAPPPAVNPSPMAPSSSQMMERLKQRREMLERMKSAATSPPPPAVTVPTNAVTDLSPQERMKKLREYNLELIKARGAKGPPLPIQLTDEEDDQLVKEGVLPPPGAAAPDASAAAAE